LSAEEEPLMESVEQLAQKKLKADQAASKKFDKLFKKSSNSNSSSTGGGLSSAPGPGGGAKVEEFSVEYWNQRREALGLSKLRSK